MRMEQRRNELPSKVEQKRGKGREREWSQAEKNRAIERRKWRMMERRNYRKTR